MSFRVNTNINANNALRNLGVTSADLSRSITRLSTGLRINNAADDPAGLIASESFRAQIGGIDQAMRNSQNAISYAKTAEGALDEVNRLLRDARALAVAAGNTGTLSESQIQANQNQYNSIAESITRISTTTQFGTKRLLDGSAGVVASNTSATNIRSLSFTSDFAGAAITTSSIVTIQVTTSATRAIGAPARIFGSPAGLVGDGSFTINGQKFTTAPNETIGQLAVRISAASDKTGVTASMVNVRIGLFQTGYGSTARIDLADPFGLLMGTPGSLAAAGVDAVANVTIDQNGAAPGGLATVAFNAGKGLNLRDTAGNSLTLTGNGNLNLAATTVGQISMGPARFQIGGNAGQKASLELGNFASSQLGKGVVTAQDGSAMSVGSLDLTTAQGASDALLVIDKAVKEITASRGAIGSLVRNTLETNVRSLGRAKESLSATESNIRDADIASEMTRFTKSQILQQSGISVLVQANTSSRSALALLR